MMEIWQEFSIFQTTSQRLADQVRTIIKKGWFLELEIIEIHQKINDQERRNTLPDTANIIKKNSSSKMNQLRKMETPPIKTLPKKNNLTLTQEQKLILKNFKIILKQ